jgi:uncharacterized membrane protein YccF (DUF307 family)
MPAGHIVPLNLAWILFGGFWMAVGWAVPASSWRSPSSGPVGPGRLQHCPLYAVSVRPDGGVAARLRRENIGTGPLGVIGNIIWLALAGYSGWRPPLAIAIALAITIIGIPFA